jgi:O-6-methylguanine DNA methyltransferase
MQHGMQSAKAPSAFPARVFEALQAVPVGCVTTYAALAAQIDCASPQAVGQALRKNTNSPTVPCHRVVRSDGSPGGFFGSSATQEVARKVALLMDEGVGFDPKGRVAERFILRALKTNRANRGPHFPTTRGSDEK